MFLKYQLRQAERRITRLYKEIERHRKVQYESQDNSDVFREVRHMVGELTEALHDATVKKQVIETRIRTARARKEIKGRLRK